LFDYESSDSEHSKNFQFVLERMNKACSLGKSIKYKMGYSNFTFELWMALHKMDCNSMYSHRKQYIDLINRAYGERFENLDHYKHEAEFKRLLSKLSLEDVKSAIQRAESIMNRNTQNGYVLLDYKGYKYFRENPSLSVWESIKEILASCDLFDSSGFN
jgi:hypothetical protein